MTAAKPRPPSGLGRAGKALWRSVVDAFELTALELVVLGQAARQADIVARLDEAIDADGVISVGSAGQPVAHPAVSASAAGRVALAKLLASLDLPTEDLAVVSPAVRRARHAANVRWSAHRARTGRGTQRGNAS